MPSWAAASTRSTCCRSLWRTVTLFNPIVYLISGFRWSFYGIADVAVGVSLAATALFFAVCLFVAWWMFKTGYRLKT